MEKSFDNFKSVIILIDSSESASLYWDQIVGLVNELKGWFSDGVIREIYLTGSTVHVPCEQFDLSSKGSPTIGHSFIAPIMDQLRFRHERVDAAILIGSGEIFDLVDWLATPWVAHWILISVGKQSIKPENVDIPEFDGDNLDSIKAWLDVPHPPTTFPESRSSLLWSGEMVTWEIDRTEYPLIYIPDINGFFHLFPIVKSQFEIFLVDNASKYPDSWYLQLLEKNPRISIRANSVAEYEKLFLSGVLPSEAQQFAEWMGSSYRLPNVDEWRTAYRWLKEYIGIPAPPHGIRDSASLLWELLPSVIGTQSLLGFSLMENGLNEWVMHNSELVGLGRTRPEFRPQLYDFLQDVVRPISKSSRLRNFGFRLIRSK